MAPRLLACIATYPIVGGGERSVTKFYQMIVAAGGNAECQAYIAGHAMAEWPSTSVVVAPDLIVALDSEKYIVGRTRG